MSQVPWWDSNSVIQLPETPGMPRHLDLLLPRFRLLLFVSRRCIQHCVTGDGDLNVTAEKKKKESKSQIRKIKNCEIVPV